MYWKIWVLDWRKNHQKIEQKLSIATSPQKMIIIMITIINKKNQGCSKGTVGPVASIPKRHLPNSNY